MGHKCMRNYQFFYDNSKASSEQSPWDNAKEYKNKVQPILNLKESFLNGSIICI